MLRLIKTMRLLVLGLLLIFAGCNQPAKSQYRSATKEQKTFVTVGLQPLGPVDKSVIQLAQKAIDSVYGYRVIIEPALPLPQEAFTQVKTPRYRADKLIAWLRHNRPDTVDYVIGLTTSDISTTKTDEWGRTLEPKSKYQDFGVFGLGYQPGRSCVISTYRLQKDGDVKFRDRLAKIVVHELGHNLGLPHCPNKGCFMADAVEKISSVDNEKMCLCAACKFKLGIN